MPNIFFMFVQFVHLTSLVIWVGGIFLISSTVAPLLFGNIDSKEFAGELMSFIFTRFEKIVFCCMVGIALSSIVKFIQWENINPWIVMRYFAILLMMILTLFSSFVISPKLKKLKEKLKVNPNLEIFREEFLKQHKVSVFCMSVTGVLGLLTIFLS